MSKTDSKNQSQIRDFATSKVANLTLFYPAKLETLPELANGLSPALRFRQKTMLAISHYHHLDGPLTGHSEVHFGIPVIHGTKSLSAIKDLFRPGLRHLWGFWELFIISGQHSLLDPDDTKMTTKDDVKNHWVQGNRSFFWQTVINSTPLFTVSGKYDLGLPFPSLSFMAYPRIAHPVQYRAKGWSRLHWPGSIRLTLGESTHPLHQQIAALEIEEEVPSLLMTSAELMVSLSGCK